MKILIGVTSCIPQALKGLNQACRETWLKNLPAGVEYRFFLGDGSPTGEDESAARATVHSHLCFPNARNTILVQSSVPPVSYSPQGDEIMLPCPDDYMHVSWKTRHMFKWALERGFDYTFQCCVDTWVNLDRLLQSGFEKYDYSGRVCGAMGYGTWARGGTGYWLSRKAMQAVVSHPVTVYSEDCSVGQALRKKGIQVHDDVRYCNPYLGEKVPAEFISIHLFDSNLERKPFTPARIHQVHKRETMNLEKASKIQGWISDDEVAYLARIASVYHNIVEIGSWTGKSSRAIGDNTPGKVYCVDTWDGKDALNGVVDVVIPGIKKAVADMDNKIFDVFCNNMRGLLGTKVIPMRMPSLEAAKRLKDQKFGMIFIDADHSYEGVKADIQAWLPLLAPGGTICGHDWAQESVRRAVEELIPDAHAAGIGYMWQRWKPNPHQYATVGFGWRYSWEQVRPYATSLAKVYKGPKLFFAADMEPPVLLKLMDLGFTIVPWSFYPPAEKVTGGGICEARWAPLLEYFKTHPVPEWLVVTDVGDVVFQENPFPWMEEQDYGVIGATESFRVGDKYDDWGWCVAAVGLDAAQSVAYEEVCCQGTLAGKGPLLHAYIQAVHDFLQAKNDPKIMDQGYGHWLRHQPPFDKQFVVPRLSEGFVCTEGPAGWKLDPTPHIVGGQLCPAGSTLPFCIVHKWMSFPQLNAKLKEHCPKCGGTKFMRGLYGRRCKQCGNHYVPQ